jgi:hypothetical protein
MASFSLSASATVLLVVCCLVGSSHAGRDLLQLAKVREVPGVRVVMIALLLLLCLRLHTS